MSTKITIKRFVLKVQTHDKFKVFGDFKNEQKMYEMFFDMLKYVYSESLFSTLYIEMKHKC